MSRLTDSHPPTDSQLGEFWLPDQPDIRVPGILYRRGNGAEVNMLGHLGQSPEVILGTIKNVGNVTILQCNSTSVPLGGLSERDTYSYQATYKGVYLLTGDHLLNGWDSVYEAVTIEIPEIDIWSGEWRSQIVSDSEPNLPRVTTLAKGSTDDFACEVLVIIGHESRSIENRSETLKRTTRCDFIFRKPRTVKFLHEFAFQIRDLVTVLLGRPAEITTITFANPVEYVSEGVAVSHSAELLLDSEFGIVNWDIGFDEPLIPSNLAEGKWGDLVSKWLELRQMLQMQVWLHLSGSYGLRSYSRYQEMRVLALVQALEAFHRALYDHPRLSVAALEGKRQEILSHLPPEHHEWANHALSIDSSLSLSQRLGELLSRAGPLRDQIAQKPNRFKHKMVKTRNYYSHYDPETTKGRLEQHEMYAAILMCSMLLDSLLLLELDFPIETITDRILKTRKYKDLLFQREHYKIRF